AAVNVLVDREDRGEAAGADAAAGRQREQAVLRTFLRLDAELRDEAVEHLVRALDVAGGAETDRDVVLTLRRQRKLRVEGGNAVNLLKGNVEPARDFLLYLHRKITVDLLRALQRGHDRALPALQRLDQIEQLLVLFRSIGKRYGT